MFRRKRIMSALHFAPVDGGNAGGAGAGTETGQQQAGLPAGVAPDSAAGQALADQQAAAATAAKKTADDANRAGGPDALKTDLAKEREKRHALEQTVAGLQADGKKQREAMAAALGLTPEQQTPEQVAAALQKNQNTAQEALTQLAVYQLAGPSGADAAKLLDSRSFLTSIADLASTDIAGLTAAIKAAVENNKTFAVAPARAAGSSDASRGSGGGETTVSINDALRAAANRGSA